VVIDHEREAERLATICTDLGRQQAVWLRLNPATEAVTHHHISTGGERSKFGLSLHAGAALRVARFVQENEWLHWRGIHFHVGSQIATMEPLLRAVNTVLTWVEVVGERLGWQPEEFSPGGGWAVPYTPDAPYLAPATAIGAMAEMLQRWFARRNQPLPTLVVEPGRELVARAGVALYTIGALKEAGDICYAFLDGGLADNPRPALYEARYHALLANRAGDSPTQRYTLAGPFCESGDMLIHDIAVPELRENDVIAVPASGAYQLSMASNYNGAPRPAVVWLSEGEVHLVQRREQVVELWNRDESIGS
jgi:diaminopimelate decarboxylase